MHHVSAIAKNRTKFITTLFSCVVVVCTLLYASTFQTHVAESAPGDNLSGYAWSDNIGWISFNCTDANCLNSDYGVRVAGNGTLSGYAWSDNIGWISFNAADVAACPFGSCTPTFDRTNDTISGWAKALAGGGLNAGGWDGWISLRGANYGVSVSNCDWSGYAWGSDVVGWITFNGVRGSGDACATPLPNLTPENFDPTGPFTKNSAISLSGDVRNTGVTTNTTFTDEFSYKWGNGGWTVIGTQNHSGLAQDATASDGSSFTPTQTGNDLYLQYCVDSTMQINEGGGEGNNCIQRGPFAVTALPKGDITVTPTNLNGPGTVVVEWTTTDVADPTTCSVTTNPNVVTWNGANGDEISPVLNQNTRFMLSCDGTALDFQDVSVNTRVILRASPRVVDQGENTTLTWSTGGVNEGQCTLAGGKVATEGRLTPGNFLPVGGDPFGGSIPTQVLGNTTYTLTCPVNGASANVTVEVRDKGFET